MIFLFNAPLAIANPPVASGASPLPRKGPMKDCTRWDRFLFCAVCMRYPLCLPWAKGGGPQCGGGIDSREGQAPPLREKLSRWDWFLFCAIPFAIANPPVAYGASPLPRKGPYRKRVQSEYGFGLVRTYHGTSRTTSPTVKLSKRDWFLCCARMQTRKPPRLPVGVLWCPCKAACGLARCVITPTPISLRWECPGQGYHRQHLHHR